MPSVCFYFQVHQPYRLRDIRVTDIGQENPEYFDAEKNRSIFRKVAQKCYLPANALLLELLQKYPDFSVAFSLSGSFLDQCREYGEDVLRSFQAIAATGKAEFLAETYYHSLSSVKSVEEFCAQTSMHVDAIQKLFGQTPKIFRNTELIYNNELAQMARLMGFRGILAEGADRILHGRSANEIYTPPTFRIPPGIERLIAKFRPHDKRSDDIKILLKNYRLSDDVAFRFSDKTWVGFPLNAETFTQWIQDSGGHTANLFMDYETFGEHQWEDTGIFEFLRALPRMWKDRGIKALTPSQTIDSWGKKPCAIFDAHVPLSWADAERDLSAWKGNRIQEASLDAIYSLEKDVKKKNDPDLLQTWRRLQTSDHFYYMSTKYWSDGDVHKYFSPYESPYEAYRRFSHAIFDLRIRLKLDEPEADSDSQP